MLFLRVRCFGPLDQLASDPPAAIDVRRFILKRELARNLPAFLEVFQFLLLKSYTYSTY